MASPFVLVVCTNTRADALSSRSVANMLPEAVVRCMIVSVERRSGERGSSAGISMMWGFGALSYVAWDAWRGEKVRIIWRGVGKVGLKGLDILDCSLAMVTEPLMMKL